MNQSLYLSTNQWNTTKKYTRWAK